MSKVYLLRAGDTNYYKIGFTTKDPHERLASLQTGNPLPLTLVAHWYGTVADERRLHGILEPYRKEGEWFELTVANLLALLAQYAVLKEVPDLEKKEPLSDDQLTAKIKKDIRDSYLQHGPEDDGGRIEVSDGYQELLRMGHLRCSLWKWYTEDALCATLPFDRYEHYHRTNCFDYCVEQGYIQAGEKGYRVDPELSEEGTEFFYEMVDGSF